MPFPRLSSDETQQWLIKEAVLGRYMREVAAAERERGAWEQAQKKSAEPFGGDV